MIVDSFGIVFYTVTLVPFAACALVYGFGSPWRTQPVGRVLFGLLVSICAVLVLGIVARVFGLTNPTVLILRVVTLTAVNIAGWSLFAQIVRLQAPAGRFYNRRHQVGRYAKTIVALAVAALTALYAGLSDDMMTQSEWVLVGLAIANAAGVYLVPNKVAGTAFPQRDNGPVV